MKVESDKDFLELRRHVTAWRKRFPMFEHDVKQIERIIENHITNYSKHLVEHRRTHNKVHIERAQQEIDSINGILSTIGKLELMAMLSQG
jgi:hypothetical protein